MNYFELLKLPQKFAIDETQLEDSWRLASSKVHPDRFAKATPSEKKVALNWASMINEAHTTLKDDVLRGLYLCSLKDINTKTQVSAEFLSKQLLWHEEIEDAGSDKVRLRALANEILKLKHGLVDCIAQLIDHQEDYEKAFSKLQQLQYIQKILSLIESKL
ncbi:Fe-S protein assembly co-chaperone HscB [Taylorella equigenitalis]|uniref:Chaperone protein HscB n=3 Tax=Taylorella equigenitalis TaxID=29575 RepID=A0A654KID9_TAYEM|nr:Fe-S protein assembly co-chaperone HscB [Taylorella equigenitalis]ADU92160.1 Chaperone protein HscB [Taylorella equigenitalis MCE9]CCG17818.1 co-chaperone protein HscB homolog [Taylorella equigenitalis 14/56]AFN35721.1 co-chaperone, HscB-like protein [Taylorella equigenitalis ATCC 35865]ASY30366.1 Fe-S protein assembly co-chaperone HscB [Taylorella equigenitalis]ASY37672.1 Fe-S protein assembly co-chaperone HscB [Taylorella equigenitalis]